VKREKGLTKRGAALPKKQLKTNKFDRSVGGDGGGFLGLDWKKEGMTRGGEGIAKWGGEPLRKKPNYGSNALPNLPALP